ncbi:PhoU family transcriptional regulator [Solibacillus silvestris]|uniref:PhoU family transcriptional regulator n=1 Tax=Solibacillus silvestris TaxID=76853 RepID=UPI003F816F2E
MRRIFVLLIALLIVAACSNDNGANPPKEIKITKSFVEENAKAGLTSDEVKERFGTEVLADVVDSTDTWLYDSAQYSKFQYDRSLEVVSFEEIKSGKLEYQLYINFIGGKAFMYSYFYLGGDGRVWQYQITPDNDPLTIPVSN